MTLSPLVIAGICGGVLLLLILVYWSWSSRKEGFYAPPPKGKPAAKPAGKPAPQGKSVPKAKGSPPAARIPRTPVKIYSDANFEGKMKELTLGRHPGLKQMIKSARIARGYKMIVIKKQNGKRLRKEYLASQSNLKNPNGQSGVFMDSDDVIAVRPINDDSGQ